jgi:hypothetical protein
MLIRSLGAAAVAVAVLALVHAQVALSGLSEAFLRVGFQTPWWPRMALFTWLIAGTQAGAKAVAPAARTAVPAARGMTVKAPDGEESMMTAVTGGGAESVMQNVGESIARTPMTATELLVQALLLSNEFVYVN